jgi:uroporphyrinogen III methyltransferase/synthase
LPRAGGARDILPRALADAGAEVVDAPIYRAVRAKALPPSVLEALRQGAIDAVTFTSASTAEHFCALLGEDGRSALERTRVASIGPVTSKRLRDLGVSVAIEARRYDAAGLAEALVDSLGGGR